MNYLADKLALIVCGQCERQKDESDLDFSTRLLSIYNSCHENIENLIEQENVPNTNNSVETYLNGR